MRASATSRTISPASISASQAKADDNKADAASPFALLVEMASAKDPAKQAKKDAQDSGDRHSASKQSGDASAAKQNDASAPTPPPSGPATPIKAAGKTGKNKDDEAIESGKAAADDWQVAAIEQQTPDQQVTPPAPVAPAPIAASAIGDLDTGTDVDDDLLIDGTAPIATAPAPSSDTNLDVSDPIGMSAKPEASATAQSHAAPQSPVAALGENDETQETQLPESAAARARTVLAARDVPTQPADKLSAPTPNAPKSAAKAAPGAPTKPDTARTDSAISDTVASDAMAADTGKDTPDIAKIQVDPVAKADLNGDGAIKNGPAKGHLAQNDFPKNDASPGDAGKSDTVTAARPDLSPVERDGTNGSSTPQSAQVSNAAFAINTIAAPQAAQHSQALTATQHVQVTAQAAPNLPALAVEISAKSQSGAKQFDIRLDPPELGRVEVRLSIDAAGKASAHLSADQPQTLSLLQKDAPLLTRALREAGLDVSQDGLNFSLRQQNGGQNGNDGGNGRFANARAFPLTATVSIDPTAAAIAYRGQADGRLDIRV